METCHSVRQMARARPPRSFDQDWGLSITYTRLDCQCLELIDIAAGMKSTLLPPRNWRLTLQDPLANQRGAGSRSLDSKSIALTKHLSCDNRMCGRPGWDPTTTKPHCGPFTRSAASLRLLTLSANTFGGGRNIPSSSRIWPTLPLAFASTSIKTRFTGLPPSRFLSPPWTAILPPYCRGSCQGTRRPTCTSGFNVRCSTELTACVPTASHSTHCIYMVAPFPIKLTYLRRCCPRCYTDYTVNIVSNAAKGQLLVFTTWKCLGDGFARSFYGRPHLTSAAPERQYGLGFVHWSFEAGPPRPNTYEIDVDELRKCVASDRKGPREAPPGYAAVAEPGSWAIDIEKEDWV